ncbi:MAG: hypothetical protein NT151_09910 [Acidobacteria bacterium]|nr:hypothetical protein [Acidobacteriota bacterium]
MIIGSKQRTKQHGVPEDAGPGIKTPSRREWRKRQAELLRQYGWAPDQLSPQPTPAPVAAKQRNADACVSGPNVECAAWLKAEMKQRKFNKRSLSDAGGPDPKTTSKILDGQPVSEDVRDKVADALSKKGSRVTVRDVPTK